MAQGNRFRTLLTLVLAVTACASPALAARRARLSADLADHKAAGTPAIDVIVHGTAAELEAIARRYNLRIKKAMRSGAVLQVTAGQLAALEQDGDIDHLSSDLRIRASDVITESIGADQVWAGSETMPSLTGRRVGVAVIDSGMDLRHAALRNRIVVTKDFTGGDGSDGYGHGTHVAGIIAGAGGRTAETRDYRGVAPGAWLVNLRVLGDDGSGYASDVIEAIDWAIEHRRAYNIRVINLSLGAPVLQSYRDDPLCEAVERAVAAGIVVVASAGNVGRTREGKRILGGITSPGNSPYAITVGALDTHGTAARSDDTVAEYSSRGPTMYDLVIKPDLVAPGSGVVSAAASGSYLAKTYPDRIVAGAGPQAYLRLSGTSMAAGVVSGAAALIAEARPRVSTRLTKTTLQVTSTFITETGLAGAGAGAIDVLAATRFAHLKFTASRNIVSAGATLVWGNTLVWGSSEGSDITANSDTLVWGNGKTLVCGNGDTLVWGNGDTLVWGNSDTLVWGRADTLVWGNADTLVWSNSDTLVWGNSDTLESGHADTLVWGNTDTLVWGNLREGGLR
jgi:serine protease AprX